jgi:hypothetical protein
MHNPSALLCKPICFGFGSKFYLPVFGRHNKYLAEIFGDNVDYLYRLVERLISFET